MTFPVLIFLTRPGVSVLLGELSSRPVFSFFFSNTLGLVPFVAPDLAQNLTGNLREARRRRRHRRLHGAFLKPLGTSPSLHCDSHPRAGPSAQAKRDHDSF